MIQAFVIAGVIAAIFALGQVLRRMAIKARNIGEEKKALGGLLILRRTNNRGAVMNIADKHTKVVVILSSIVFIGVLVWLILITPKKGSVLLKTGLTLLVGGAAGNMYERIRKGYVTDYFSFCFLKKVVFNISDIFIIVGALIAALGY